jgi:hypothetical protein
MRTFRILALMLVIALPNAALAGPSIVFDELSHDFGEVEQNERLEHAFSFRNGGTEELVIEQLIPS